MKRKKYDKFLKITNNDDTVDLGGHFVAQNKLLNRLGNDFNQYFNLFGDITGHNKR